MKQKFLIGIMLALVATVPSARAEAPEDVSLQVRQLEERVNNMETYLQELVPKLNDFSRNFAEDLDYRLLVATDRIVLINPVSRKFSRITTNAGDLLVAADGMEKVAGGYTLKLKIGNPTAASFSDLKITLRWGRKWDPAAAGVAYEAWRKSLTTAAYAYNGTIESGQWTDIAVRLESAGVAELEHLECELDAGVVKLLQRE